MTEPMILVSQRGHSVVPFPSKIYLQKRKLEDGSMDYTIIAADLPMAIYKDLAPAKMEIQRLIEVWQDRPATKSCVFQFMKDVK